MGIKNGKWQAALYIRLSKEDGNEQSYSVGNQRQRLTGFIQEYEEEFHLVEIYIDDGYTGTDSNRAAFQRMLRDIASQRVNCVIVKDLSRLSRNYIEAGHYLEDLFIRHDVRFISLELPRLDSYKQPEAMNSILVPIQNVINDDFCRTTSIKIRGVLDDKRRRGQFIGGFAPYGYRKAAKEKGKLVVDEEAAVVVRDIFHWYVAEGLSKNSIVARLNALGIPSPGLYKKSQGYLYNNVGCGLWSYATVNHILSNEVYTGNMVQGRFRVKSYKVHTQIRTPREEWFVAANTHQPLISKEVFEKAQRMHRGGTKPGKPTGNPHLFRGLMQCADCGAAMKRNLNSAKTVYYNCSTYRTKSKKYCTKHTIREEALERALLAIINLQTSFVDSWERIRQAGSAQKGFCAQKRGYGKYKNTLEQKLERIRKAHAALYVDWKAGALTADEYKSLKTELAAQEAQLQAQILEADKARQRQRTHIISATGAVEVLLASGRLRALDRGILWESISAVLIHEGGALTVVMGCRAPWMAEEMPPSVRGC